MKKTLNLLTLILIFITIFSSTTLAQDSTYTVVKNDSLWTISQKFATTVAELKRLNNLTSDYLDVGTKLIVSAPSSNIEKIYIQYIVNKGDTLGLIAEQFGTKIEFIKSLNGLTSDMILVGQILKIPAEYKEHIVKSGDTLYKLALANKTTVARIKMFSTITFDDLRVGQILKIPYQNLEVVPQTPTTATDSKTYFDYFVVKGDTVWTIAVKFGIPMQELLSDNGLNSESVLNLGQKMRIAKYTIAIKSTPSTEFGEYLDWWTQAQYVCPINKTLKITDFTTKNTFTIKRTIGAGHADCEPLTSADEAVAKNIFNGYTWSSRPVVVEVDGRKIAASMSFYPHGIEYIPDNNFIGHFDLYFSNCIRHVDGQKDPNHQANVEKAAGR